MRFNPKHAKPIDMIKTWKLFKGDTVQVIAGRCEGQISRIVDIRYLQNQVVLDGLNLVRRNRSSGPYFQVRRQKHDPETGETRAITTEQGIHASNVALIDPVTKKPTGVDWGYIEEELKADDVKDPRDLPMFDTMFDKPLPKFVRVRVSKKSGAIIPIPQLIQPKYNGIDRYHLFNMQMGHSIHWSMM